MGAIATQLEAIRATLPKGVELVAVSKFHPTEQILEAYHAGQRIFGESRVQELQTKQPALPPDIEWHFIGTLQRNKVKYIIPYIHTIHSGDSTKLLLEIDRQSQRVGRTTKVRVLLQVHISGEPSKQGFSQEELTELLQSGTLQELHHLEVVGLMGMASLTNDMGLVEQEFARMQELFAHTRENYFATQESFRHLSIGMTHDYPIALRHGATYVRIGTGIFGERNG